MNETWKLKPCPFCGNDRKDWLKVKSEILEHRMNGADTPCSSLRRVWIECEYCGCKGKTSVVDAVYDNEILAGATVAWNQRKGEFEP